MFTGIIEEIGSIVSVSTMGSDQIELTIGCEKIQDDLKLGDSVAINGVCLTVVRFDESKAIFEVSPETMKSTTFANQSIGSKVNLERALRLSDRLDGHLVSGHVDGIGTITNRTTLANAILITVTVPSSLTRYMIEKGSVAVDGTSLTINKVGADFFEVSIIPHTAGLTTVGFKKPGEAVNIETDLIGKYIEKFMSTPASPSDAEKTSNIDMAFLAKSGFL